MDMPTIKAYLNDRGLEKSRVEELRNKYNDLIDENRLLTFLFVTHIMRL